jgi:hypothetical protein
MVPGNEHSTVSLADYEILEDLGIVHGARPQCHESENRDVHSSPQLSAGDQNILVSGGAVIDDAPQSQEAVRELVNECWELIKTSLDQESVASLLHVSTEMRFDVAHELL